MGENGLDGLIIRTPEGHSRLCKPSNMGFLVAILSILDHWHGFKCASGESPLVFCIMNTFRE